MRENAKYWRNSSIYGVLRKTDPIKEGFGPFDCNLYELSAEEKTKIRSLPKSLDEALDELEKDHGFLEAGGVFPKRLIELWIKNKRAEASRYNQMPQPVEYDMYFDN